MNGVVSKCGQILADSVLPAISLPVFEMTLAEACVQFKAYQACVTTEGKQICPNDDMEDTNVLADITHGDFSKYNWTCNVDCRFHVFFFFSVSFSS